MEKIHIAKPNLGEKEAQAAYEAVMSGWVTQGPRVAQFEEDFAQYVGSKYAVAVSNCTTALHLSMIVAGVSEGDEVICPSMSYVATANCIRYVGAKPVFAEVGEDYNLDIEDVERRITPKTKAIILVHQIGMPADIDAFQELCKRNNLILVEDAACAIGSEYKGKKIGSHSDLVCFSFHPRKIITTGDGGMIATSNEEYANRLKLLRQHAMSVNDRVRHNSDKVIFEDHVELGYNYRLTDIQAAVGIEQLKRVEDIIEARRKIARYYIDKLSSVPGIVLPKENENCKSNYQSFSILLESNSKVNRNDLMQKLLDKGISTRRGIMNSHRCSAYAYEQNELPRSEHLEDNSVLLPLFVPMEQEKVDYVVNAILEELL